MEPTVFLFQQLNIFIIQHIYLAAIFAENTETLKILFESGLKVNNNNTFLFYKDMIKFNLLRSFSVCILYMKVPVAILDVIFSLVAETDNQDLKKLKKIKLKKINYVTIFKIKNCYIL